jgi:hypothetical protein
MSGRRFAWRALACLGVSASVALAQDTPPTAWGRVPDAHAPLSAPSAVWLGGWSPLRPISDAPRGMTRAPLAPGLLDAPAPLAGAFFLAGAPGALARDLGPAADSARFGDLRLSMAGASGDYRRPLDPGAAAVIGANGQGWARVGTRGVAIGRFVIDRESLDPSSNTGRIVPYASTPFLATDSVTPPMERTRARLEGALGWDVIGFGIGIAAGLEVREHTTVDFPLRRAGRSAQPSWSVGAERALPWLDARLGAYARATEPVETNILNPRPEPTVYFPVRGFDEPISVPISAVNLFTREQRRAHASGLTAAFTLAGTTITATHEQGELAEDGVLAVQVQPQANRWRTTGSETRVQAQRALGQRWQLLLVAVEESHDGAAERIDLEGTAYVSSHARRAVELDLRGRYDHWRVAFLAGGATSARRATDFAAELFIDLDGAQTFGAVELARDFRWGALSTGVSGASSAASGSLPAVEELQPVNQRLLAPMLAYEVAETRATAAWLTAAYRLPGVTLLGGVRAERSAPAREVPELRQPTGTRSGWSVTLGLRY